MRRLDTRRSIRAGWRVGGFMLIAGCTTTIATTSALAEPSADSQSNAIPQALADSPVASSAPPPMLLAADAGTASWSPLGRLLAQAEELVSARQFRPAYRLLQPNADLYAGDPEFDFLLGLTALESGRPGEAVVALERVLINAPGQLRARAEVSRAYAALQDQAIAQREFEALAARQLPAETRMIIARYLDALTRVRDQPDPLIEAGVSVGIGWDSRVDIVSPFDSWVLTDGTGTIPQPRDDRQRSAALHIGGDVRSTAAVNGRLQWTTALSGMVVGYPSARAEDQQQVDASTGFIYRNQCHQVKMLGQVQAVGLDYDEFRNGYGLVGQWQCDLDARRQLGGFAQRFEFRFPDQATRDASRQLLGISYAQSVSADGDAVMLGSVHTGREYSRFGLADQSYDFSGIRLMLIKSFAGALRASVEVDYEKRRFDGPIEPGQNARHDEATAVTVRLQRAISERWTVEPQIILTHHHSSLATADFSRLQAQVLARYRLP